MNGTNRQNRLFTMSDNSPNDPVAGRQNIFSLADRHPGGARRDRTDDLMLAKHALSQLSYGPIGTPELEGMTMVGLGRLELPTSRLSSARSNQLSYKPEVRHPQAQPRRRA
jgi:hypothetical protein